MNKGLIFTLGLLIGTAGGGLLVNTMLKQQYEQKADEEIAACRNAFVEELAKRRKEYDEKSREEKKEAAEKAIQTYSPEPEKASEMILTAGQKVVATVSEKGPYVIPPDVFDDDNNPYKRVGMMLFNDSTVLKDDKVLDLDEIDTFVGREALTHFGQYEEDRVCIRNEMLGIDYEILLIDKSYEDYIKGRSSSKESE